jgi:hypothetical protein
MLGLVLSLYDCAMRGTDRAFHKGPGEVLGFWECDERRRWRLYLASCENTYVYLLHTNNLLLYWYWDTIRFF